VLSAFDIISQKDQSILVCSGRACLVASKLSKIIRTGDQCKRNTMTEIEPSVTGEKHDLKLVSAPVHLMLTAS